MKMKNIDLVLAVNGLCSLRKECTATFPVKVAHTINRNIKKLLIEVEPYEEDRKEIMSENISDSEKGKKLNELLNYEENVDLDMIDLKDLDGINLTLNQMETLEIMIRKDDES